MLEYWRTDNIEEAIFTINRKARSTLVRVQSFVQRHPRIRLKLLSELAPFRMNWNSGWHYVKAWEKYGGVMICMGMFQGPQMPDHEVQVMTMCPHNQRSFNIMNEQTLLHSIVYQPPTWEPHFEWVSGHYPDQQRFETYWEWLKTLKENKEFCHAAGLTTGIVGSDTDIRMAMGLTSNQFRILRKALFRRDRYHIVRRIALRVEPDEDHYRRLWWAIGDQPEWGDGRLVVDNDLRPTAFFWKRNLAIMHRRGWIDQQEILNVYYPVDEPEWDRLKLRREQGFTEMRRMIARVESMKWLRLRKRPALPQTPKPARVSA